MTQEQSRDNQTNGNALVSLLIGILAVVGIFLIGEGTIIYVFGLFLGIIALKEIKTKKQQGTKIAWLGIILNSIGVLRLLL